LIADTYLALDVPDRLEHSERGIREVDTLVEHRAPRLVLWPPVKLLELQYIWRGRMITLMTND
jgi:hypothetical protein